MKKNDTAVGYKCPPEHTQFQPGYSGNPAGRPKGTKNLRTDLAEELAEKVTVTEGGQQQLVSKQRAMVKSMMAKAMKGDTSAARTLVNLIIGFEQLDSQERIAVGLTEDDREVLEAFKTRMLEESSGGHDHGDA